MTLDGLEGFPLLTCLTVTFNQLASTAEFDHVKSKLTSLAVIGNPFCLNPDYAWLII